MSCIRLKSVKRAVVISDAYFLPLIPTDCTFLTKNLNVVLFSNIHFPTCFGISKPSSGRLDHTGKQNYINKNIYHLQTSCTFALAFISFPLFSSSVDFFLLGIYGLLIVLLLALDLYLLYIIQTNENFMTKNLYVVPLYILNFHKYFGFVGQFGGNLFILLWPNIPEDGFFKSKCLEEYMLWNSNIYSL